MAEATHPSSGTRIVILGTGFIKPDPKRSGLSIAIVVKDVPYLVDAGPGLVRRAVAAYQDGVKGLEATNLRRVFITHLHSDHTMGLPDLILTPWEQGRTQPLEVYGPRGIRAMTEHILEAYKKDIHIRIHNGEDVNATGFQVNSHEIDPGSGLIYEDRNVTVKAFPVKHGPWSTCGYRFETPDRTIVLSGDTRPVNTVIENSQGCDVLLHEVYSQTGFDNLLVPQDDFLKKFMLEYHTSTRELVDIAHAAKPGLLILYHQMFLHDSRQDAGLLDEIQHTYGYTGQVVSARDLDVY